MYLMIFMLCNSLSDDDNVDYIYQAYVYENMLKRGFQVSYRNRNIHIINARTVVNVSYRWFKWDIQNAS